MTRIRLSDGSSWPRPALESDERYGVGHRLRHLPAEQVTRDDLMEAASIIEAYGALVVESTRDVRDMVCREIRAELLEARRDQ